MDFAYDDEFAQRDGFANSSELRSWFGNLLHHGHEEYDVIRWEEIIR